MLQPGDVISYEDMNRHEGKRLQKGMNFKRPPKVSVFLMSRRKDALYTDRIEDDGRVLIYQGHDIRPEPGGPDPQTVDQPLRNADGTPTDNGKFFEVAKAAKQGAHPGIVHVYEKIQTGIWVFNGEFELADAWQESGGSRKVCKFELRTFYGNAAALLVDREPSRLIPSEVKAEVWKRDGGKCRRCGKGENLHFDHDIPFSKGGSSFTSLNVQILCARCNLQKSDRVE